MTERSDLSDRDDPQLDGHHPEPKELKSETLHGRNFAGASFAANEEEQTADERQGTPENTDVDYKNTDVNVADHGLSE